MKSTAFIVTCVSSLVLLGSCSTNTRETDSEKFDPLRPVTKNGKSLEPNNYWHEMRNFDGDFSIDGYMLRLEDAKSIITQSQQTRSVNLTQPWLSEGPGNIGGRFNVLEQDPNNSEVIYAGAANGGVFKTTNGGTTWTPIFDDHAYLAIGAVKVAPSNSNQIWVGTGDRNFGGTSQIGFGVYTSADAGQTWQQKGLQQTGIITEIQIDPSNVNRIFASTLGNPYTKTNDRGVYRTLDGGDSWQNILFVSDSSGACDLLMHPENPEILYACFFNRINQPFQARAAGPDASIYKTIDGGDNWVQLTNGLPAGENSRVGISIDHNNPEVLYAIYVSPQYNPVDAYKSTNGGASWTALNIYNNGVPTNVMGGFGWYFGQIHVNPYNSNNLLIQGVDQYVSNNGGNSWSMNVPDWWTYDVHADKHDVLFLNATSYIIATDGGLYRTNNNGLTWTDIENIPVTQFYHIALHPNVSGLYGGGAQDNGSMSGNVLSFNFWERLFGGDGFRMTWLSSGIQEAIYEVQNGGLYYSDGFDFWDVSPLNQFNERVNWDMPYYYKEDDAVLYAGTYRILKMNAFPWGTYQAMSPDLTKVSTGNFVGSENRHTITEIEGDQFSSAVIYAGTNDGWVWRGNQTGNSYNWTNISTGLPDRYVTALRSSPNSSGTIYAGFSGYRMNDYAPYLFKSTDFGATWNSISGNLPNLAVYDVLVVPGNGDELLFVATEAGVFYTEDGGQNWDAVGTNIPFCTMTELALDIPNKKLIVGTFSRSMFSYDVSWIESLQDGVGLNENELNALQIYPNPSKEFISLANHQNEKYAIFNMTGTLVKTGALTESNSKIIVSDLANGTYLLKCGNSSKAFIKQGL